MSPTRISGLVALLGMLIGLVVVGPPGTMTALALVDGNRVVFTLGCDEPPDGLSMTLLDPLGSASTTTKTTMGEGAGISSDGSHIAVAGPGGISVSDPDGTGAALIAGTDLARFPTWSPDDYGYRFVTIFFCESSQRALRM